MGDTMKMSSFAYASWLFAAIIADILSIIPIIGSLFIVAARATFWINSYAYDEGAEKTLLPILVELFLGFSVIPACTFFVYDFRKKNKAAVERIKKKQADIS